jgi:hypothetical protein
MILRYQSGTVSVAWDACGAAGLLGTKTRPESVELTREWVGGRGGRTRAAVKPCIGISVGRTEGYGGCAAESRAGR